VLPSGLTLRHVLVIGIDGVRFDLLGPEAQIAPLALAALGDIPGNSPQGRVST
jgi:hypothetical protein